MTSVTVITLFGLVLAMSLFLPAFVDDIYYLLLTSRGGYDHWQTISIFPECGGTFAVNVPLTLLPGRALSWLVQLLINDYYSMRLIAIAMLLAWIAYLTWFIKRCLYPDIDMRAIAASAIGFLCLGTMPIWLLLSRPDTAMAFAVTFYFSIPFIVRRYDKPSTLKLLLAAAVFFLVTSWFVSVHLKALLYVPLIFVAVFSTARWNKIFAGLLAVIAAFTSVPAWVSYWRVKLDCPAAIAMHDWEGQALLPSQLLNNPPAFFQQLFVNISHIGDYAKGIMFPVRSALPPLANTILEFFAAQCIALFLLAVALLVIAGTVLMIARVAESGKWRQPSVLLVACLMAAFGAQLCLQTTKLFYNSIMVWVSLALSGLALADYFECKVAPVKTSRLSHVCLASWPVVIISQFALLATYMPFVIYYAKHPLPNGVIGSQSDLLSPMYYSQTRDTILEAAKQCNIAPDASSEHLAIDMHTYLPMKQTFEPYRLTFRYGEFQDAQTFLDYLQDHQSTGVITLCRSLPPSLLPYFHKYNGVCCHRS